MTKSKIYGKLFENDTFIYKAFSKKYIFCPFRLMTESSLL